MQILRLSGLALLALLALPAHSDPLPLPTTVVTCTADKLNGQDPSSCQIGGAAAALTLQPFVSESVQVFAPATDADGPHGAGAFADIQYSFQVVGGNTGDLVPLLFTVNLDATASSFGHALGFASIFVSTSQGNTQVCVATNAFGCPPTGFSGSFQVMARSSEVGTVNLEVTASAGDSPLPESARASADPLIVIDPGFPGANQYSVVLSQGVGNGLPVPEPASSALMSVGGLWLLALLGVRRRRAR